MPTIRHHIWIIYGLVCLAGWSHGSEPRPNIVLLLTDDQGYGDLAFKGNPHLDTPHIDAFARESIELTRLYVSPVCAPTRASLMTGRYNYRTGVTDTWRGSATMHQDEVTLAEVLADNGYATGLFGKWHLGDTYPYRPQDQGFDEVLMHRGGGIGQPSDPPGGSSYFDPILFHNGVEKRYAGYCMDVYTDTALEFIEANHTKPFFVFLATNTPHTPLEVAESYWKPYHASGLPEDTSRVYGMIENIDDNFARVLTQLDALGLSENTIVIYMSDNGPKVFSPEDRHLAGLNGEKTDVYEGGIRTPFFIRWPARFNEPNRLNALAAHIDLMPTLLDACGLNAPKVDFDGISILPLLEDPSYPWPERTLFFQWHRGSEPSLHRHFAAVENRYKLLQRQNKFDQSKKEAFELYDLKQDPGETTDIADKHPEIVESMRAEYQAWFSEVRPNRGYADMPSWIGSAKENPVVLTHQDRKSHATWGDSRFHPDDYWPLRLLTDGDYTATLHLYEPASDAGLAKVRLGDSTYSNSIEKDATEVAIPLANLAQGERRLSAWIEFGEHNLGTRSVSIELIRPNRTTSP